MLPSAVRRTAWRPPGHWLVAVTLCLSCFLPLVASAQGVSVLTGTVTDAATGKPAPDVTVTARSPSLQGEQTTFTDASGVYRIPQLPPGTYSVDFSSELYKPFTRGDIRVTADHTLKLDVPLVPTTMVGYEEVKGTPPVIDVGSPIIGNTIDQEFTSRVAVARPGGISGSMRSIESLALTVPQAQGDLFGVSISGATSPENSYVVDGLTVNNPGFGINGTPLSMEFADETHVITGGYLPEFGRSTGGTISATTRSGGNEFHGSVYGNLSPGILSGPPKEIRSQGTVLSATIRPWNIGDFGATLGGYIVKDRLWFFAGIQPSFSRYQVERDVNAIRLDADGKQVVDPQTGTFVTDRLASATTYRFADERVLEYIGKLTYLVSPDVRVSLTATGTPTSSGGNGSYGFFAQGGGPAVFVNGDFNALALKTVNSSSDLAAKLNAGFLDKHLLIDATAGWHHQDVENLPIDGSAIGSGTGLSATPAVLWRRTQRHSILDFEQLPADAAAACDAAGTTGALRCPVTNYATGGPGFLNVTKLDSYQANAVVTLLVSWLGHHILKAGADVQMAKYDNTKAYSGGTALRESTDGALFYDSRQYGYMTGPDQATLLPFVRSVSSQTTIGGFLQDSWTIANALTVNAGVRYDAENLYDAQGRLGLSLPNQWSPRFGLVWDPTGKGKAKVFANVARYYESVPLDIADRALSGEPQVRAYYEKQPGCDPRNIATCRNPQAPIPLDPTNPNHDWLIIGGDSTPVDPNIQPQSSDELVAGGELELFSGARAALTYTHRSLNRVIEDMSRDEGTTYFIGNPHFGIAQDFPLPERNYDALTLAFTRNFRDGWLAQASYTYTRLRGNYDGLFRAEDGQLDPNINSTFDLVKLLANQSGPLSGDITHTVKAYGAKEFALGGGFFVTVGGSYTGSSGPPLSYLGANVANAYGPGQVYILPRGAAGRIPWVHEIDGRLAITQRLGKDQELTLSVDAFNLFNFQSAVAVDENYTFSGVLPIVGGTKGDLPGNLRNENLTPFKDSERNLNFLQPTTYQPPRTIRVGVKLSF